MDRNRWTVAFALLVTLVVLAIVGIVVTARTCNCVGVIVPPDGGALPVDAGLPPPPDGGVVLGGKFVSGYYAGWFPEMYPHDKIDFSAMTHLVVGRAVPHANGTITQGLDSDDARGLQRAQDLSARAHAAGRKAVLMLGGAGDGAAFRAASSPGTRSTFVTNILGALDAAGMDGVDLDWEEEIEHSQWLELTKDLRAARPNLIIMIPVFPVNINYGLNSEQRSFFAAVHPYVDQVNAMTYGIGMAGPWDGWVTWHTGALTNEAPNRPTSISSTMAAYAATGIPKAKLGLGIGFYGINYGPPNTAPLQQPQGAYQADDVEWRYSRIVNYLNGHAANYHWDANAKMGYLSFPSPGFSPGSGFSTAGFLSYEDEQSIGAKGAWAKANGYGGAIIWVINYGCTNASTGANPLLTATRQAFLSTRF